MRGLDPWTWGMRVAWLVLPFSAGPALAAGLDPGSTAVRAVASTGLWAGWALVVVALLVPRPAGLTVLRVVAPAGLVATVAAAVAGERAVPAVASTVLATAVAFAPETGSRLLNGGAYGEERRHLLRPPVALLLGPLPLAGALLVVLVIAGPLLLAAERWVLGSVAMVGGLPVAMVLARALHALVLRWVVFVPAGLVLKDHLTLGDPVLFRRSDLVGLGPARGGGDAADLTARAPGLALELRLRHEVSIMAVPPGSRGVRPRTVERVLFSPTRPGAVLAEARRRRLPVG